MVKVSGPSVSCAHPLSEESGSQVTHVLQVAMLGIGACAHLYVFPGPHLVIHACASTCLWRLHGCDQLWVLLFASLYVLWLCVLLELWNVGDAGDLGSSGFPSPPHIRIVWEAANVSTAWPYPHT